LKTLTPGFTLIELIVTIGVLSILLGASVAFLNPPLLLAKARDSKRLSDLSVLSAAVEHYIIDIGSPPGSENMHLSDFLPEGQEGPLQSASKGWIDANMNKYIRNLFTDPKNEGDFVYRYIHNGRSYEFDGAMEVNFDKHLSDNGDDENRYEVGSDLSLL